MSEYSSTYRSSRSPKTRNPLSYDPKVKIVTYPKVPRIYDSGGPLSIPKGLYVYPKPGEIIFFYSDFNGTQRQLRNKEQVQEPKREGNELVGTTTGKSEKGINGVFIEVSWVNSYWDHRLINGDVMKSPEDKELEKLSAEIDTPNDDKTSGFDTSTLGYIAIGAALLLTNRNRKK